jgi:preprotein translocase subunit SecF
MQYNSNFNKIYKTVLTTLFTIIAVYIFVPSVREFTFPLIVGIVSGAYSQYL